MERSPYAKYNRFKRTEDLGNKAYSYIDKAQEQVNSKAAFTLLAEALDDVVTGFFDMLNIPYSNDWLLSERLRLLSKQIELPLIVKNFPYEEFDRIICEDSTIACWLHFRDMHKELIFFAAGFCEDYDNQNKCSGKLITSILHLLQRFPDSEIEHALNTPSPVSGLAPLYHLSDGEKERVRYILQKRANTHTGKSLEHFLK